MTAGNQNQLKKPTNKKSKQTIIRKQASQVKQERKGTSVLNQTKAIEYMKSLIVAMKFGIRM